MVYHWENNNLLWDVKFFWDSQQIFWRFSSEVWNLTLQPQCFGSHVYLQNYVSYSIIWLCLFYTFLKKKIKFWIGAFLTMQINSDVRVSSEFHPSFIRVFIRVNLAKTRMPIRNWQLTRMTRVTIFIWETKHGHIFGTFCFKMTSYQRLRSISG